MKEILMKLWGGRFEREPDRLAFQYNASIDVDWRLAPYDIQGSLAWARAITRAGIISETECRQIESGLNQILQEVNSGRFQLSETDEDVHTAIERRLTELSGAVGGKLHTARSRNDQVATDFRLWMLEEIPRLDSQISEVQQALVSRAGKDFGIILPGYTHLQRAQPILLSHWWLSHFWPLNQDRQRLIGLRDHTSILPLGSSALAGAPYSIDRQTLAQELGFQCVSPNSIYGVSDRDFAVEFLFIAALVNVHLSRLAEMLVIFSTAEFGFIELSDTFSSGSSLMPQKKNPDPLELTRGKAGTLTGLLSGLLTAIKGTPSAYDKDLQEDKAPVFSAADTLEMALPVVAGCLNTLSTRPEKMSAALDPALLATDLADYLVKKGLPFRQAHEAVGWVVRRSRDLGLPVNELPLSELKIIHPLFEEDTASVFDFKQAVDRRNIEGGTGSQAVQQQLELATQLLEEMKR
jgi:argininosuccinate lyase